MRLVLLRRYGVTSSIWPVSQTSLCLPLSWDNHGLTMLSVSASSPEDDSSWFWWLSSVNVQHNSLWPSRLFHVQEILKNVLNFTDIKLIWHYLIIIWGQNLPQASSERIQQHNLTKTHKEDKLRHEYWNKQTNTVSLSCRRSTKQTKDKISPLPPLPEKHGAVQLTGQHYLNGQQRPRSCNSNTARVQQHWRR